MTINEYRVHQCAVSIFLRLTTSYKWYLPVKEPRIAVNRANYETATDGENFEGKGDCSDSEVIAITLKNSDIIDAPF